MSRLKRFLQNLTDTLADAAMLEMGVNVATPAATAGTVHESLEENLIEVAFAEAADYDDIHEAILREHRSEQDIAHPDDCQYGDNDLCFA
jgi:glutamate dehydrogenase/leucine dehydrogenase